MKKIFYCLIFIAFLMTGSVFATDYFTPGKTAFNKKDYQTANTYFVKAVTMRPNDPIYRYYYAQTLTYLKNYEQAKKEYGYVMQLAPNSQLYDYSYKSLNYLNSISKSDTNVNKEPQSDNYIKRAITNNGELVTWDTDKMPVKVYINNSKHVNGVYVKAAKDALKTWENVLGGKVQFMDVSDLKYADVTIVFNAMAQKSGNQTLGLTNHNVLNGYMHKATVTLYTVGPNYQALHDYDVYNVALHEFGHMLGLSGHSDVKGDIMYSTYTPQQNNGKLSLSQRDKNTINALYSIDKNPYATGVNSITKVLGSKEERMQEKLQQSLEYIKTVPDSPIGYVNVGNVYSELGKEYEAIQYFEKALAISPNDHAANNNLALLYYKRNDLTKAEPYYKTLIKNEPKAISAYVDLMNLYIRNKKTANAKSLLNTLLYRNPAAKQDKNVQKIIQTLNK